MSSQSSSVNAVGERVLFSSTNDRIASEHYKYKFTIDTRVFFSGFLWRKRRDDCVPFNRSPAGIRLTASEFWSQFCVCFFFHVLWSKTRKQCYCFGMFDVSNALHSVLTLMRTRTVSEKLSCKRETVNLIQKLTTTTWSCRQIVQYLQEKSAHVIVALGVKRSI